MERKEVIEILKSTMIKFKTFENGQEFLRFFDALEMAISSLETDEAYQLEYERTTKNDLGVDCISRDEVCRYIAEFVNHEFSTREEEELIDNIITGIERMPSVTPQEPILDKIREQIKSHLRGVEFTLEVLVENDPLRPKMEGAKDALEECLELIDKAETEAEDGNDNKEQTGEKEW